MITRTLGSDDWITDLEQLDRLKDHTDNPDFVDHFASIKRGNKERLADLVARDTGVELDTDALFDIQVKRIHEYKRQLMNILHTVALYQEIKNNPDGDRPKVAKIIAGKAAPEYDTAKDIIALTNRLAKRINNDPDIGGQLKLAFIPDYNVQKAEIIIPGANISEQISTAGTEASGTSNMKFALDGAITLGTRDGANVEIGEVAGEDNIFFFGKSKEELDQIRSNGYNPQEYIDKNPKLRDALAFLDGMGFEHLANTVRHGDRYMIAADFEDYCEKHRAASDLYHRQIELWRQKTIANTIAGGHFSSDKTVAGYNRENWHTEPIVPQIGARKIYEASVEMHDEHSPSLD